LGKCLLGGRELGRSVLEQRLLGSSLLGSGKLGRGLLERGQLGSCILGRLAPSGAHPSKE
jgi:hypothetical protein